MQVGWLQIIALVAGSTVLATLLSQGITILREWRGMRRDARLSALHLALVIDQYAEACSGAVADIENYRSSRGNAGEEHVQLPPLPPYPEDMNWRALDMRSATDVLSFRVSVERANGQVADAAAFGMPHDCQNEVVRLGIELGLKAVQVAKEIRIRDGTLEWRPSGYGAAESFLLERKAALAARERQLEEWRRKSEPTAEERLAALAKEDELVREAFQALLNKGTVM